MHLQHRLERGLLLLIILTGWTLALVGLGERSLWADEGFSAVWARKALAQGLLNPPGATDLPLHVLVTIGVTRLHPNEMLLRFPSAMAATLSLPVVYVLGRRLFSASAGLAGAFLLAISPFAIGYAQEARAYAFLELLACLSLILLVQALVQDRWHWWAAYAAGTVLLLYTHHFSWFVVGAEVLYAFAVLLVATWRARRPDRRLLRLGICLLASLLAYVPLLPMLRQFWQQSGAGADPARVAGLRSFRLSLTFIRDMVAVFGARSYGWQSWLFAAGLILGLASLGISKRWGTLLLVALWLGLPLAALALIASEHFFDFRYLIFLLPMVLLLAAEGVGRLAAFLARAVPLRALKHLQPALALALAVLLFVPANSPALASYYRGEKENWRGIAQFLAQNALPGDAVYVSPRYWANPLLYYEPEFQTRLVGGSSKDLSQLTAAAVRQPGLWFLRYAGPLGDPTGQLTAWAVGQGFVLLIDGSACGSGIDVYYGRSGAQSDVRKARLALAAAEFCPTDPRFHQGP